MCVVVTSLLQTADLFVGRTSTRLNAARLAQIDFAEVRFHSCITVLDTTVNESVSCKTYQNNLGLFHKTDIKITL